MKIVIIGLSITSSWGNGHATTYRGLVRELVRREHEVLFLEQDVPWYAPHRDLIDLPGCEIYLYESFEQLVRRFEAQVACADAVIVGSYVQRGIEVGEWVTGNASGTTAFYDIDTPVTIEALDNGRCTYLSNDVISRYDIYLSFTGGPLLQKLMERYGVGRAVPLYCSFDPERYFPEELSNRWDLGYLGTYSNDRQPSLEAFLIEPAFILKEQNFVVAGPQYPPDVGWPSNVERFEHIPPDEHRRFYNRQRYTLNLTRSAMIATGYSPSVRLFEAAACGVPIISDCWEGIETFFVPDEEILLVDSALEVTEILSSFSESQGRQIGQKARARVLAAHTAAHRAEELENYLVGDLSPTVAIPL